MKILEPLVASRPTESRLGLSWNDYVNWFTYNGHQHLAGLVSTTMATDTAEAIGANFVGYSEGALKANGVIWTCEQIRVQTFSEVRFQFREFRNGRPQSLFGGQQLALLERPWPGGTTGDLLAMMLLDADLAGNAYLTVSGGEVVRLRPDWVDILLEPRVDTVGRRLGFRRVGYAYYEGGRHTNRDDPAILLPDEVCHFAPMPDPTANYRGMSWITPVVREIQADTQATKHKLKFFENAATPNLAVSLPAEISPDAFERFVDKMDSSHKGADNAYKTLYTAGGADVTVIGADLRQLDFKVTQGAGESRIAAASGVGAVVAQFSEGMQGSSLNAGNFGAARRRFGDMTMRPLWRNAAGSLEVLIQRPTQATELWYDPRDVSFLQEDEKDAADIRSTDAQTIRALVDAGYDPDSVVDAVTSGDMNQLKNKHSGLFSVQLQQPGSADYP